MSSSEEILWNYKDYCPPMTVRASVRGVHYIRTITSRRSLYRTVTTYRHRHNHCHHIVIITITVVIPAINAINLSNCFCFCFFIFVFLLQQIQTNDSTSQNTESHTSILEFSWKKRVTFQIDPMNNLSG